MRILLAIAAVSACTIGESKPVVVRPPPPDPDRMPSTVLAHQDPGADTSHNKVLSRTELHAPRFDGKKYGCYWLGCSSSNDASGGLVLVALAVALRRRSNGAAS